MNELGVLVLWCWNSSENANRD